MYYYVQIRIDMETYKDIILQRMLKDLSTIKLSSDFVWIVGKDDPFTTPHINDLMVSYYIKYTEIYYFNFIYAF